MKEITSHKSAGLNQSINIFAMDEPGLGGAHHRYVIQLNGKLEINFQKGPLLEAGTNGISNESLLAIVEDRLKCFQAGQFACRENAIALTKIQEAMHWLHHRTRDRLERGVEGTMVK